MKWVRLSHALSILYLGIAAIGLAGLFTALYWIIERQIGG